MGQNNPAKGPPPKTGKPLRERKTSIFTAEHGALAFALLGELRLSFDDAKSQVDACRERERARNALPSDSAAKFLRRNGLAAKPLLSDFELGRLSLALELAEVEAKRPRLLISKSTYNAVQGAHGQTGKGRGDGVEVDNDDKIIDRLTIQGYFAVKPGSKERGRILQGL